MNFSLMNFPPTRLDHLQAGQIVKSKINVIDNYPYIVAILKIKVQAIMKKESRETR